MEKELIILKGRCNANICRIALTVSEKIALGDIAALEAFSDIVDTELTNLITELKKPQEQPLKVDLDFSINPEDEFDLNIEHLRPVSKIWKLRKGDVISFHDKEVSKKTYMGKVIGFNELGTVMYVQTKPRRFIYLYANNHRYDDNLITKLTAFHERILNTFNPADWTALSEVVGVEYPNSLQDKINLVSKVHIK